MVGAREGRRVGSSLGGADGLGVLGLAVLGEADGAEDGIRVVGVHVGASEGGFVAPSFDGATVKG